MGNVRNRLLGFVSAVVGVAAALSFLVFSDASASASPIVVGAALGVTWLVLMGGVYFLTLSAGEKTQDIVEAIRGYSIGQHATRLDAERFGPLEDVAIACNELGAALSEGQDPNLGTIKRRPRPGSPAQPSPPRPKRDDAAAEDNEDPNVGQVRRIPKASKPANEAAVVGAGEKSGEPVPEARSATDPAVTGDAASADASDENDTVIDTASQLSDAPLGAMPPASNAEVEAERGDDIERLYADYTAALAQVGNAVDLDYDEFRTTIAAEQNALIEQHGCKAIRFEVRVNDDDVSLLPHLVR